MRVHVIAAAAALLAAGAGSAVAQTAPSTRAPGTPPPSSAFATTPGPYAKIELGGSFSDRASIDQSWLLGGAVGWRFSPNFRSDLAFDWRPDFNQQTNLGVGPGPKTGLTNYTFMLNGYYDFNFEPIRPLVPYVGAGVGIARNEVGGVTVQSASGPGILRSISGNAKNQFAWNAMAGVSYYMTPTTALDVGYRYIDAGDTGLGSGGLQSHEVTAGFRFGF